MVILSRKLPLHFNPNRNTKNTTNFPKLQTKIKNILHQNILRTKRPRSSKKYIH